MNFKAFNLSAIYHKGVTTFLFLLSFLWVQSQGLSSSNKQSIKQLKAKISSTETSASDKEQLITILIKKTRASQDQNELYNTFALAAKYTTGVSQIAYGDSLIAVSKKIGNTIKISDAYIGKGMILVGNKDYSSALSNYLIAYDLLKKENNDYLLYNLEYNIAQTRNYLGENKEARESLIKTVTFFRNNHQKMDGTDYRLYYLYALISLIDTNSFLGRSSENNSLIDEGKSFLDQKANLDLMSYMPYLISSEGMQAYYLKNFPKAITLLSKSLSSYNDHWGHPTDQFYLGMSYWENQEYDKAIPYFSAIDKEYEKTGKIDPKFRPAFEKLYKYYSEKNNNALQVKYIDKLLAINKTYEKEYKDVYAHLKTDYDIDKLEDEKLLLTQKVSRQKYWVMLLALVSIIGLCLFSYSFMLSLKRKKQYQKLFKRYIIQQKNNRITDKHVEISELETVQKMVNNFQEVEIVDIENITSVNPMIENHVLKKLDQFEKSKMFIDKNISLKSLAAECGTNTAYLSKIINTHKGNNFKSYLINLRLEYTMEIWREQPESRLLTIQEIALKSGFSTAQSFSKNFQLKYEISPKYFLQNLNKDAHSHPLEIAR